VRIKLTIDIDPDASEPEVTIRAADESPPIAEIIDLLRRFTSEHEKSTVEAYWGSVRTEILQSDIIRVYTEDRRLTARTPKGEYQMRTTLRELEGMLDADWFVRISRYEIVNLNRVSHFDYSFKGTMKVIFEDGTYSWVSRRFLAPVQQRLAMLAQRGGKRL
jgi:DNA-binding LytR/AlgR family response regulator